MLLLVNNVVCVVAGRELSSELEAPRKREKELVKSRHLVKVIDASRRYSQGTAILHKLCDTRKLGI